MNRKLIVFVLMAIAVIFVSDFSGTTLAAAPQAAPLSQNAYSSSPSNFIPIHWPDIANLSGSGAYESVNNGPWFKVNTVSGSAQNRSVVPAAGEGGNIGVEDIANSVSINDAVLQVGFSELASGESDSMYGANAWSIQLNTNTFFGSNYESDLVQFVLQNNVVSENTGQKVVNFGIWFVTNVGQNNVNYSENKYVNFPCIQPRALCSFSNE